MHLSRSLHSCSRLQITDPGPFSLGNCREYRNIPASCIIVVHRCGKVVVIKDWTDGDVSYLVANIFILPGSSMLANEMLMEAFRQYLASSISQYNAARRLQHQRKHPYANLRL